MAGRDGRRSADEPGNDGQHRPGDEPQPDADRQPGAGLDRVLKGIFESLDESRRAQPAGLSVEESGRVTYVGSGIAHVEGLPGVGADELVAFPGDQLGIAFNIEPEEVRIVLLDESEGIEAGMEARRTRRVVDVPVGDAMLGRVVDAVGRPLDGAGDIAASERWPAERQAPTIMDRAPVVEPLQTGIEVIDAIVPIGRGQRELIIGDRQTGKTAIALETIINQKESGVICVYCAIGQRTSAVARLIADLRRFGAMDNCMVVVAAGEDPLGQRFIAPYAATTMAEYFVKQGRDVLVIYDDLGNHAKSYRELSLLLRRPPAREAYPGDIFYIHSRLLERSTHLIDELGGGSLTAMPIVETEAQNISAYIPTNLISITDGQIYLSPVLFQQAVLPAVDVGHSVSRVGGKAQLPAYRDVSGDLRLSYAQFEELEAFARFGTTLEAETRRALERGRRVREVLKQPEYQPLPVHQQVAELLAVTHGVFDGVAVGRIAAAGAAVRQATSRELPELSRRIDEGQALSAEDIEHLVLNARRAVTPPVRDRGASPAA